MASTRTSRTAAETAADATTTGAVNETPARAADATADAPKGTTEKQATADSPSGKRTVAQFIGHVGTERIITKEDQDRIVGTKGVAKKDLVWAPGNSKLDVTDVDEDVLAYLKTDDEFKLREVEVSSEEEA